MKRMKMLLLAAITGLLSFAMVGCGFDSKRGVSSESPEEVAEKFIEAMAEFNLDEAKKYCSGSTLKDLEEIEKKMEKADKKEAELGKEMAKVFFKDMKVKSNKKTESFWADGKDSCKVKVEVKLMGTETSSEITMKRDGVFSPWYVSDIEDDSKNESKNSKSKSNDDDDDDDDDDF